MTSPKNLQPYIDLGWFTVPLRGELKRLEDGTKTIPGFGKNWLEDNSTRFNKIPSPLGGVVTGKLSNLIAVDCDNQATLDMFTAMAPDAPQFASIGKPEGGGTLLFSYTDYDLLNFRLHNKDISIDYYTDTGFIYLPTLANETKGYSPADLTNLPKLNGSCLVLLKTLSSQAALLKGAKSRLAKSVTRENRNNLSPLVESFVETRLVTKALFKALTPVSFREEEQYIKQGFLHPANIVKGSGSDYLMKVSAILGADYSISIELYYSAMTTINSLWEDPMDADRLDKTVIVPMTTCNSMIDGVPIWQYDPKWETRGLTFTNKLGEILDVFYDDTRLNYYVINFASAGVTVFEEGIAQIGAFLDAVATTPLERKALSAGVTLVRTISDPTQDFGYYSEDGVPGRQFNLYKPTVNLAILQNPNNYAEYYIEPTLTIKYFKSLIPDKRMRNYLLRFIKHKLMTFSYSPVVLYFLGIPGSGKDMFVDIMATIVGQDYISKPSTKEFLEKYNGYMLDRFFVHLDEYGNQLNRIQDKDEALGKIKAYSGKSRITVRTMRNNGFEVDHSATFISTANKNPLPIEEDDRRMCLLETPNKLADEKWVLAAGGISSVHEAIMDDIANFCYYLATEVEDISLDEYQKPPETVAKQVIIMKALPAGRQIVHVIVHNDWDSLKVMAEEAGVKGVFDDSTKGMISERSLMELYESLTNGQGTKRGLAGYMQDAGFRKMATSRDRVKVWYYEVPSLAYYNSLECPFDPLKID